MDWLDPIGPPLDVLLSAVVALLILSTFFYYSIRYRKLLAQRPTMSDRLSTLGRMVFHNVYWLVPSVVLLGAVPPCFCADLLIRAATFWDRRYYHIGDDFIWGFYQKLVLFFYEHYNNCELIFYGDVDDVLNHRENAIYISNHQTSSDWIVADMVAARQGQTGRMRFVMKWSLRFVPFFGFYFGQHGCVFVRRGSGSFDETSFVQQIDDIKQKKSGGLFIIFPEGSRFNPERPDLMEKSRVFARNNNLPELNYVLVPKYRGVQLAVQQLSGHYDAFYDVTLAYENTQAADGSRHSCPSLFEFIASDKPRVHVHLKRFDLKTVPVAREAFNQWLLKRFVEKERMLKRFYGPDLEGGGTLEGKPTLLPLARSETLPSLFCASAIVLLLIVSPTFRRIYTAMTLSGSFFTLAYMTLSRK